MTFTVTCHSTNETEKYTVQSQDVRGAVHIFSEHYGIFILSLTKYHKINMGTRRIFSRGGQIRGLGTKVPQQGPGMEPRWGSGAKPPEADDRSWKYCINHSSTKRFALTTYVQNTLQHFQRGQVPPPPVAHDRGRPWFHRRLRYWTTVRQLTGSFYFQVHLLAQPCNIPLSL